MFGKVRCLVPIFATAPLSRRLAYCRLLACVEKYEVASGLVMIGVAWLRLYQVMLSALFRSLSSRPGDKKRDSRGRKCDLMPRI